ncbi:MAG: hypothetical protein E7373_02655 [Clostridiales bacterium]|nr:hypothetical protein [Clostridiales bacterium]
MNNKPKIFLIANAHIDSIWQWEEDEGVFTALSTYRSAIKLLDEYDFVFCHNEAYVYEQIEKLDKKLFEDIKKAVKDGKWIIMGGWYIQPDCLLPKGESIARQVLVGKNYFLEKFGVEPKTAVNLDPFGHSRGIVQIIKKCNQTGYLATRPSKMEFEYPDECFNWVGYDGSSVKAYHCSSYSTPLGFAKQLIEKEIQSRKEEDKPFIKLWGVGNHGGGASRKDLKGIEELKKSCEYQLVHSSPDKALLEIPAKGEVASSLNNCNVGCYTSGNKLKSKYLAVERLYYQVEKMATTVAECGGEYPEEQLKSALKDILFSEFHDVLPGTSIKAGEDYGLAILGGAEKKLKDLRTSLTSFLCSGDKVASEGEYPIFVFNDQPRKVKKYVECELCVIPLCGADEESVIHIKDASGKEILSQTTKADSNINMDWRKRIGFYAELEPTSFNRFDVFVTYKNIKPIVDRVALKKDFVFENQKGRLVISKKTGAIKEYTIDGKTYLNENAFSLFAYEDNENPWGHRKVRDEATGKNPKPFKLGAIGVFEGQSAVKVVEDGEIFTTVESLYYYKQTQAVVQYKIYKKDLRVDVKVGVVLANNNIFVKAHLPMINKSVYGGQMFGEEEINCICNEHVAQEYLKIPFEDKALGISMQNNYGVSYDKKTLKLSLLRGTTYCAHPIADRPIVEKNRYLQTMDLGLSEFNFSIFVDEESKIASYQREIGGVYAMQIFPSGEGELKTVRLSLSDQRILLEAFKKAESGAGSIARLFNSTDKEIECEIEFNGKKLKLNFTKYEVKTLEIDQEITESYQMKI